MMLDTNVLNVHYVMSANADVVEFIVKENSKVTRKPVKDLSLPKGMTFGGLVRNGEAMLVSGGTQFMAGDTAMVFCSDANMKKVESLFV